MIIVNKIRINIVHRVAVLNRCPLNRGILTQVTTIVKVFLHSRCLLIGGSVFDRYCYICGFVVALQIKKLLYNLTHVFFHVRKTSHNIPVCQLHNYIINGLARQQVLYYPFVYYHIAP